jgi:hypothetical protein
MLRIKTVKVLEGFAVRLGLSDGSEKTVDLSPYMRGPIFERLRQDPLLFRQVRVDEELGTLVWPNGADIDPDVLILERTPENWLERV